VPPSELGHLRGAHLGSLAPQIEFATTPRGHPVSRRLTVRLRLAGDPISVAADIARPRGDFAHVRLGVAGPGTAALSANVPDGRLVGLTFGVTGSGLHAAANGGTGAQTIATGNLRILSPPLRLTGVNGFTRSGDDWRYVVAPDTTARLRAPQPTDARLVPVLATPAVAERADEKGRLAIAVEGSPLVVRLAGTIPRFPTARGDAVVGDVRALATALNADAPGSARVNEVWLRDANAAALDAPPFDTLAVATHARVEHRLESDPLARGVLYVLAAAALVALALALVGLALGLVADVRDEQGELFDLESQGAAPTTMRAHLRLRSAAIGAAGITGGIVLGLVLAALVVQVVALAADTANPEPPLHLVLGWPVLLAAFAVLVAAATLLAVALTQRAFAARTPGRWTEVGT
jgi:hypothetical protein